MADDDETWPLGVDEPVRETYAAMLLDPVFPPTATHAHPAAAEVPVMASSAS